LELQQEIGEGLFGKVYLGKWKNHQVALKLCHNKGELIEFMREANLMISIPPHPYIVQMFGVSIDGTQPIIVMEYCNAGIHSSSFFLLHNIYSQTSNLTHSHTHMCIY
jgi:serine/threonine protein kinase